MLRAIPVSLALVCAAGTTIDAAESLSGRWKAEFEKAEVTREYYFAILEKGGKLSGALISPRTGAYPFTAASLEGTRLSIDVERPYKEEEVVFAIRGELAPSGSIAGTVTVGGEQFATFTMTKVPDPIGIWEVKAGSFDQDKVYEATLEIRWTPRGYGGTFRRPEGEVEIREMGFREDHIFMALSFETDEGERPIRMGARFVDENTLRGEWGVAETDRGAEWSATRLRTKTPEKAPAVAEPRAVPPKTERAKTVPERRAPKIAGEWRAVTEVDDGRKIRFALKLARRGSEVRGEIAGTTADGVDFTAELGSVKWDGRKISFGFDFEGNGDTVRVEMAAEIGADRTLSGVWEAGNSRGEWSAKRVLRL